MIFVSNLVNFSGILEDGEVQIDDLQLFVGLKTVDEEAFQRQTDA